VLSIVIPTLNEAGNLPGTVAHTLRAAGGAPLELIVSDCRSRDGTREVAAGLGARVADGATCRGDALNAGAAVASGDVLLFLHADTVLPHGFAATIRRALANPDVVGGAFEFEWGPHPLNRGWNHALLKVVVFCNRFRYRRAGGFFGDQGIFVRRAVFHRLGGFPECRLMEDLRFSLALSRLGRTAILRPPALTSPRRFVTRGVLRQFVMDLTLLTCESWGVRPDALWTRYNDLNHGTPPCATTNATTTAPAGPGQFPDSTVGGIA
jgi:rSAM/selenodomain-associated transferase 2